MCLCSRECVTTHTSQHARWRGAGSFPQASNFNIHREKSKEIRKDAIRFYFISLHTPLIRFILQVFYALLLYSPRKVRISSISFCPAALHRYSIASYSVFTSPNFYANLFSFMKYSLCSLHLSSIL